METALQWGIHLISLAGLFGLFRYVKRCRLGPEQEGRITACVNVVETRTEALERSAEIYRRKIEESLKRLNRICDRATVWLERGPEMGSLPPSSEENELRGLVPVESQEIPTLRELEQTRFRLKNELIVERSEVLRDQLG